MHTMLFNKKKNSIQLVSGRKKQLIECLIAGHAIQNNYKTLLSAAGKSIRKTNLLGTIKNAHQAYRQDSQVRHEMPSRFSPLSILKSPTDFFSDTTSSFTNPTKQYKYIYFNGSIYLDCFAPKWPGRAFDRMLENRLQNLGKPFHAWDPYTVGLVISITKKCVYRCEHCYAINTLGGKEILSYDDLLKIAKDFQQVGAEIIAWEGGEPLMRFEDLLKLISATYPESDAWLATTAYGLTNEKAIRLKEAGLSAAIVSLDHYDPDKHNRFRGNKKSFDMVVKGIDIFRENGILPNLCVCATKDIMRDDGLYKYLELAKEMGVGFIQILDATPSGNYLGKDVMLSEAELAEIKQFHLQVNTAPKYRNYPSISARALLEDDSNYGCCAGNGLCYVDSSGNLQACDLLQISFGNVVSEGVDKPYRNMKQYFPHLLRGRCPAQTLHQEIARVYEQTQQIPLSHESCPHILKEISTRGLPDKAKFIEFI